MLWPLVCATRNKFGLPVWLRSILLYFLLCAHALGKKVNVKDVSASGQYCSNHLKRTGKLAIICRKDYAHERVMETTIMI